MPDFLDTLVWSSKETIASGYYEALIDAVTSQISLKTAILKTKNAPVITEIKASR